MPLPADFKAAPLTCHGHTTATPERSVANRVETTLNDPEFHAARSREAHGLIADLEAAKAEVTHLYERCQALAGR